MTGSAINGETPTPKPWSLRRRVVISAILLFHLTAVLLSPLSTPPPSSGLAQRLSSLFSPYQRAMFLDHGYRFFAPEPGPGHLVRYEVTTSDGAGAAGQFPDRDRIWPRLLYHRWFMLSETAFAASSSLPSPAEEQRWMADVRSQIGQLEQEGRYRRVRQRETILQGEQKSLEMARQQQQRLLQSIAQWINRRQDGVSTRLILVERLIPTMEDVLDGVSLDDQRYTPEALWIQLPPVEPAR